MAALTTQVEEQKKEISSLVNNKVIWFVGGMLTAGLTAYLVRK